eukprot:COSAG05_NODE_1287_length_5276_cov_10.526173_3_plen_164_part_00
MRFAELIFICRGLVTFDSEQTKLLALSKLEVRREAKNLWSLASATAARSNTPGRDMITSVDGAGADSDANPMRVLPMAFNGRTLTLLVNSYKLPTSTTGASKEILLSHIVKATECCGTFSISIIASKTGRQVIVLGLPHSLHIARLLTLCLVTRRCLLMLNAR